MGQFRFTIPELWAFEKRHAATMHVVGQDSMAWPCRIVKEEHAVSLVRNRDESGHVFMAFPFRHFGELVISTGTLPESSETYDLTTELARGTLNRLRNQLSTWEEGGLEIGAEVRDLIDEATRCLSQAVFDPDNGNAEQDAAHALESAMQAIFAISQTFANQIVPVRKNQVNIAKFWLGAKVAEPVEETWKVLKDRIDLVQVEDASKLDRQVTNVILGPMLDASPFGLSQRLQEVDDFDARRSVLMADVRETVGRLPPSVKLLHAVSGLNGTGHRLMSYPQQLQATIDILQTIEDVGTNVPAMVSFDCPWGERLAWSVGGVHPLQIADSLLRRGVNLAMLGLDIHLDYSPTGSLPRDPLQWVELVDLWSQMGMPLVICLRAPFGNIASSPTDTKDPSINSVRGGMSDLARLKLLETVIPMLLARPAVQGIIWQQATDLDDARFPGSGLLDEDLHPKPVLQLLHRLRQKFW